MINNLYYIILRKLMEIIMKNVQQIEEEISQLPPSELAEFRAWFEKFDSEIWDKQFEADVKSGKLDKIAQKAIKDFKDGKYKKI